MLYQTVLFRRGRPIKIIKVKILSWTSLQETFSSTFDVDVDDDDLVSQVLQKRTAGGWGCYELRHVLRDCLWIFCILCAVVLLQDLSFQMINGWWCFTLKCIILNFSANVLKWESHCMTTSSYRHRCIDDSFDNCVIIYKPKYRLDASSWSPEKY